jgi:hypothetical protein
VADLLTVERDDLLMENIVYIAIDGLEKLSKERKVTRSAKAFPSSNFGTVNKT